MNAPEKLKYDRSTQDVGNIVHLEHYNCCIDDQRLAVLFYVVGLGATRDPYIFPGMENIWLNFGRTQVHMPSRAVPPKAERLRGTAGFVVPSLEDLAKRLEYAGKEMKRVVGDARAFSYTVKKDCVEATDPWGTRVRCHAPSPEYGPIDLGLAYVDFDVPLGTDRGHRALLQRGDGGARDGVQGARGGAHRQAPETDVHRDEGEAARVRRPPHPDLHRRFLQVL
jgi:hypothetical protein